MCEKCKRITNPQKEMVVHMKTREPGTKNEFQRQMFLKYCPVCGGRLTEPRQYICREEVKE